MFSLREYRQPTHRLPQSPPLGRPRRRRRHRCRRTGSFKDPRLPRPRPRQLQPVRAGLRHRSTQQCSPPLRVRVGPLRRGAAPDRQRLSRLRLARTPPPGSSTSNVAQPSSRRARASSPAYYLTFVWTPPSARARRAEALFYEDPRQGKPNEDILDVIAQFRKTGRRARRHHGWRLPRGPEL